MTDKERLIRARLAVLTLAAEVQNVARACKVAGVSRSQFYTMKKAYETYGKEGLAPRVRRKPEMPNRTPALLEEQILLNTRANPTFGYFRLAREMKSAGIGVSPTMVRYVWQRHDLSTRLARLEWANKPDSHAGRAKTGDGQNGVHNIPSSASVPARTTSSRKSVTGGKSFTGKGSGVDWTYWSQRVRESLTR